MRALSFVRPEVMRDIHKIVGVSVARELGATDEVVQLKPDVANHDVSQTKPRHEDGTRRPLN